LPYHWLKSYLTPEGRPPAAFRVKPAIRAQAVFRRLNLVHPFSWPSLFPVIFCRNVMIYLDRKTQEKVISSLAVCLEPGGYLFVGHSEGLAGFKHHLEYIQPAVYRKADPGKGGVWNGSL